MEQQFLETARRELINGYAKKRHPFRYFTLATLHQGLVRQRTVVLRKMLSDFTLVLYTDQRSQKVTDINTNNAVSALFYHPKKLLQVRLEGQAELETDKRILESFWKSIPEKSKKDYITEEAPGTAILNPDHTTYNAEQNYFCVIKIVPTTIETLQLKRPNHVRIQFTKTEENWQGQFIVP